jgi:uncharacterized cupredoxin-like copper-binding protein
MLTKIALVAVSAGVISTQAFAAVPEVVHAKLWNHDDGKMGITTDVSRVKAGKIDFEVTNDSKSMVHEMLVVKVKTFKEALPYNDNQARIIEDKTNDFGEVSELEPGQSGSLTLNLKPGKYMLVCNIPGHYKSHMYTDLLVTQ